MYSDARVLTEIAKGMRPVVSGTKISGEKFEFTGFLM
jgi:hypothetical protein